MAEKVRKVVFHLPEDLQLESWTSKEWTTEELADLTEEYVRYVDFLPRKGDFVIFESERCPFLDGSGRYEVKHVCITYTSDLTVRFFVSLEVA